MPARPVEILSILRHTPPWVWLLLAGLAAYGWFLGRPQRMTRARLLVLPLILLVISILGMLRDPAASGLSALAFFGAYAAALALGAVARWPRGVRREGASYAVPGSWVLLLVILALFGTKYTLAVASAMQLPWAQRPATAIVAAGIFGLATGLLGARALGILRTPAGCSTLRPD